MKNLFGPVSRKDLIFISVVLVILIVMIAFDTDVDILVNYDKDMLQITSPRLNVDIPHSQVQSVTLIHMPTDFGTAASDSYSHEAYCAGTWENPDWGTYTLCVIPGNEKCILVKLDSATVAFSCTTDEKTETLFISYRDYLDP